MTALADLTVAGLTVSRETFDKLRALEALVQRWTPVVNLVSRSSAANLWERHILDSAQIFAHCPKAARLWVDLGSGGGFPGLVVAVLAQGDLPDLRVVLVEADVRKATFLRQAVEALDLQVKVISERIESLSPQNADVVSARALAPLDQLLGLVARHLRPGGVAILPKGAQHAAESVNARLLWDFTLDSRASLTDADAAILLIRDLKRARQ